MHTFVMLRMSIVSLSLCLFVFTLEASSVRTHDTGMHIHAHIDHAYILIDTYR